MSFIAKYRGECVECGCAVLPKQEATYVDFAEGEIKHVECPDDVRILTARETCPRCFVELPVTGICGTCDA